MQYFLIILSFKTDIEVFYHMKAHTFMKNINVFQELEQ